ncbi:hypothetical protein BJ322DRAFT_1181376 [Thelephora terrestris]|uniref:Uncharacterized protein n=1 Tax=Thelephora terrestris TaxID=56493 RepID=A0A9P6HJI4_9AGAM|nr:hypothetical protein BJ322DRAFT_1181376 [Thelephora terrestris]
MPKLAEGPWVWNEPSNPYPAPDDIYWPKIVTFSSHNFGPTTSLDMQRSARSPALFRGSQLVLRSLWWKPTWSPSPRFVALMNEDEELDLVVISTFDSLDVCCHEELLKMPINGLLRLIVDLNSRLSAAMQITDTLTKSEGQLRMDIEAVLGYKRFSLTEREVPAIASRDSGLGLLGILAAGHASGSQAVSSTPPRSVRQKVSNNSLRDRQKLTVSMRGKPRLSDLLEEDPETGNLGQSKGKSPIRRSDGQHSLTQVRRDRPGEAATLPRARNLRNLQVYEGRRVSATTKQRSDRSNFDAPAFESVFRAKPKLYHSLPTRKGRSPYESSSARNLKFRHDLRKVPSLRPRTPKYIANHREPSLGLNEMDQLVCNMLSVSASSVSADCGRVANPDLEEFGVI